MRIKTNFRQVTHVTSKQVISRRGLDENGCQKSTCKTSLLGNMHIFDVLVAAVAACASRWPVSTAKNSCQCKLSSLANSLPVPVQIRLKNASPGSLHGMMLNQEDTKRLLPDDREPLLGDAASCGRVWSAY